MEKDSIISRKEEESFSSCKEKGEFFHSLQLKRKNPA